MMNTFCDLDLVTNAEGQINEIRVAQDTFGDWTLSRCAEDGAHQICPNGTSIAVLRAYAL